jgi:hypothetical protein
MRTRAELPPSTSLPADLDPLPADVKPTREQIAARAYDLYEQRGGEAGHDVEDWLNAERQLNEELRSKAVAV